MNELIERLAREAGIYAHAQKNMNPHLEAFAKAVARECAEIVRINENPFTAAQAIRERFGL